MSNFKNKHDYVDISFELEQHHELFYRFWQLGEPIFKDDIPTACVGYDEKNDYVVYYFNPDFYNSLTTYELAFVIAHECLHITLNHCPRFKDGMKELRDIQNIAMDIVVNELLVSGFGFDRNKIKDIFSKSPQYKNVDDSNGSDICWLDTSFKDKDGNVRTDIEANREVEYYYNILKKDIKLTMMQIENGDISSSGGTDSHDDYSELDDSQIEKVSAKLGEELSDEAKKSLKTACGGEIAGTMPGSLKVISKVKAKVKREWETVIKKWAKKTSHSVSENEQWAKISRRMSGLETDMFIPSVMEEEKFEKSKIEVWFFQDTSGSCYYVRDRFFAAAKSLPPDKFSIRMFCFDTEVYKTTLESGELFGFGGTLFNILETAIQREIVSDKKLKYPKAIFVITDGYASDHIYPQHPERWHWFLTDNYTKCIDKACNCYDLSKFE